MCSASRPWRLRHASTFSNRARASSRRPRAASALMYQKVQTRKAFSGGPKSSASTYRNTKSPRRSSRSIAATVPANRGSSSDRNPSSPSRSRLASSASPWAVATKLFFAGFQQRSETNWWMRLACAVQYSARWTRPRCAAIRANRSQPAQHITLENVCTRGLPRSSQSPASGWSYSFAACSPNASRRRNSTSSPPSPRRTRRRSKNTWVAVRMAAPYTSCWTWLYA